MGVAHCDDCCRMTNIHRARCVCCGGAGVTGRRACDGDDGDDGDGGVWSHHQGDCCKSDVHDWACRGCRVNCDGGGDGVVRSRCVCSKIEGASATDEHGANAGEADFAADSPDARCENAARCQQTKNSVLRGSHPLIAPA